MPASPSSPPTPLSLLQRLCEPGDAAAWDWFARLYTPLLFFWARRTGMQDSDAADLVQETFALLVAKLPDFRYEAGGSFRGWLRTVLLNKWREQRRRRSPETVGTLEDLPEEATANLLADDDYRRELVLRALTLLRPDFRPASWEAFWQTVALGRSAAEAAAELGLTANAVRVAKCRILQRLRIELDGLLG